MIYDFVDDDVALRRSSMTRGDCDLENRDCGLASLGISGERIEEGVSDRSWDIVHVLLKCHVMETAGEVDFLGTPGTNEW